MQGTSEVLDRLRAEGFEVSVGYLQYLLRERVIPTPAARIGGVFVWSPADEERLRGELIRRGRGPEGHGGD